MNSFPAFLIEYRRSTGAVSVRVFLVDRSDAGARGISTAKMILSPQRPNARAQS
ncbi:hypothetical protein HMPREF0307_01050 [Corynebacterium sp. DNF00584]|nr:hypothetical protein HMPREF0307_01050 [Corynebacterium sp. DNF00584]